MIAEVGPDRLVLLLGGQMTKTPLGWPCLEGIQSFLHDKDGVRIKAVRSSEKDLQTLEGYLKDRCIKRMTAGYVASVLAKAGVVEVDAAGPARVRLRA